MISQTKVGRLTMADVQRDADHFEAMSATEIMSWTHDQFGDAWAISSSMGPEDIVLIDLAVQALGAENVHVFTLDTGRLHAETLQTVEEVRNRLGVAIRVYFPTTDAVEALTAEKGLFSFRDSIDNRKECCGIRKLEPLKRALRPLDAWVTGLRRDQNVTRTEVSKVEVDLLNGGLAKINPLAEWSSAEIWDHIKQRQLPYNPLHDAGYPSIGCAPCTRAVEKGEDERAGRWWWETPDSKECGLHGRPDGK